jgi:hypothetical protein
MKSTVEIRETVIVCVIAKSANTFIFFDKRLKQISTIRKNPKWSDCNAIVYR